LYVAKRNGRNQVVRWDRVPDDVEIDESKISRTGPASEVEASIAVPYHAVTALISALAYRDLATAEHSRRVADYCVIAAEGLMSLSEIYILEMAALLHDIGKVGVPDSILLKPGPLSNEEWNVMQTHDTICDAYDAMVADRVYRKGCTPDQAFAELRRCAGSQFDPALVDHFIANIQARDKKQTAALSAVSKQTALSIGVQIERLSSALDQRDLPSLQVMAHRLGTVADRQGVYAIAEQASRLEQAVSDDAELLAIVETANELLDLCRATQRSYLHEEPTEETSDHVEI
jgi:HD-GYP domain-containing protein (c-di-GMP phosphodiesterase class II)